MTMGEYIKYLRTGNNPYNKRWSQEELGQLLDPPVNRGAVNKWELGRVENIKRTHIEQLARIFGVKPCELMCFESKHDEKKISKEVKVIEQIQEMFGADAVRILHYYYALNNIGKEKALESLGDLTELPKYTKEVQGGSN